jgi:hypothetical protein
MHAARYLFISSKYYSAISTGFEPPPFNSDLLCVNLVNTFYSRFVNFINCLLSIYPQLLNQLRNFQFTLPYLYFLPIPIQGFLSNSQIPSASIISLHQFNYITSSLFYCLQLSFLSYCYIY